MRGWSRRRRRASRWGTLDLVLRGLGVVYLIAFTSLRAEVRGLYGRRGIVPVEETLQIIGGDRRFAGRRRWWRFPTLLWLGASDRALVRLCRWGQLAGLALALGVLPKLAAAGAWTLYLSFVTVGSPFLNYQWDGLLLEAGFLGVLAAPGRATMRWRRGDPAPAMAVALFRLLSFRLHFESGMAKLQSADRCWRDGSACGYHHQTQPLPTPLAHLALRLPRGFHRLSTAAVLALECAAPFLIFGGRRSRRWALLLLEGLQAVIAATGNFAFFNLLTAVVTLSLLDRPAARLRRRAGGEPRWRATIDGLATELEGLLQLGDLARRVRPGRRRHPALERAETSLAPLRLVGSYGLFAVMTRARAEIVIEGSMGTDWRPYELRHKPGDPGRRSRFVALHPRLDWQMWFAALSPAPPPWFEALLQRLLEGSPPVLALFASNPFPEGPPRFIRAVLYQYRMTDPGTRRRTGRYWEREPLGLYFPPVCLGPADSSSNRGASSPS